MRLVSLLTCCTLALAVPARAESPAKPATPRKGELSTPADDDQGY